MAEVICPGCGEICQNAEGKIIKSYRKNPENGFICFECWYYSCWCRPKQQDREKVSARDSNSRIVPY